jgi:hypothetical protein
VRAGESTKRRTLRVKFYLIRLRDMLALDRDLVTVVRWPTIAKHSILTEVQGENGWVLPSFPRYSAMQIVMSLIAE